MINCHACGDLYNEVGYLKDTYDCPSCGHIYRLCPADNYEYHKNQYRKDNRFLRDNIEFDDDGSVNEHFHKARKSIVEARRKKIEKYLDPSYSVLDIGAGAGTFIQEIKDLVGEIECNEVADNLLAECERLGFKTYPGDILNIEFNKQYDVVSAWHVLEHVEDIQSFRDKLVQLTKKYCIIEVPLIKSMNPANLKVRNLETPTVENWDGHSHYFTAESLEEFFEEDFEILSIEVGVQDPAVLCIMEKR